MEACDERAVRSIYRLFGPEEDIIDGTGSGMNG